MGLKIQPLGTESQFSSHFEFIVIMIGGCHDASSSPLYHVIRDMARTKCCITHGPKVLSPVNFTQFLCLTTSKARHLNS